MIKALIMAVFGLLIGMVGMDPTRGSPRFTFGLTELLDGVGFIPVIMGLFGVAEVFENLRRRGAAGHRDRHSAPSCRLRRTSRPPAGPSAAGRWSGFLLGLVPGMTGTASSVLAYVAERKASKHPEKFGTGVIEGVAGPETANNAHANAALIPLFTMGIPASPSIAVLMGAFMMNGLIPGPLLFKEHASVAWGVIASLYIGNVILLVLNLPLIPLWVKFLKIPYTILMTVVLAVMMVGAYTVSNTVFDVFVMLLFGVIGYVLRKLDFPAGSDRADPDHGSPHGEIAAPVLGDVAGGLLHPRREPDLRPRSWRSRRSSCSRPCSSGRGNVGCPKRRPSGL